MTTGCLPRVFAVEKYRRKHCLTATCQGIKLAFLNDANAFKKIFSYTPRDWHVLAASLSRCPASIQDLFARNVELLFRKPPKGTDMRVQGCSSPWQALMCLFCNTHLTQIRNICRTARNTHVATMLSHALPTTSPHFMLAEHDGVLAYISYGMPSAWRCEYKKEHCITDHRIRFECTALTRT